MICLVNLRLTLGFPLLAKLSCYDLVRLLFILFMNADAMLTELYNLFFD